MLLKAAGFTNLGRDHLDYHPTVEDYLVAKLRLFSELLPEGGTAVINADAAEGARALEAAEGAGRRVLTVGRAGETLKLERLVREGFAQRLSVAHEGRVFDIRLAAARRIPGFECTASPRVSPSRRARSPAACCRHCKV